MFRVLDRPSRVRARRRRSVCARPAWAWCGSLVLAISSPGAPAPAGAQAPPLDAGPVWMAPAGETTSALAAADVDLDGDLDLVRGTASGILQLFLNRAGELESTPTWTAVSAGAIAGLALGDLNGDGRADLAVAVRGDSAGVYWSSTASVVFPDTPSRRIPVADAASVILADVDADGDADVVCADGGEVTVHRNDGGNFARPPVWTAAGAAARLVAGDVDGDGRLDLCASDAASGVRLYAGEGGAFGAAPVWSQTGAGVTGVALGDLDGDGDLDLAAGGTAPAVTRLFENQGGTFAAMPVFTFGGEDSTASVALGDVDADGDLDLACGNTRLSRVYRNGGAWTQWSAAWEEPAGAPAAPAQVRWLDVDGDVHRDLLVARDGAALYHNRTPPFGALAFATPIAGRPLAVTDLNGDTRPDLLVAPPGAPAALHWNLGTRFDTNAAWTSAPGTAIGACAAADVNQDGALDLVVGGAALAVYLHDGTALAPAPVWTQALDGVTAVAVRDLDLDGRPDLVAGRTRTPSLVCFLNRGGTFLDLPDWEGGTAPVSSIALADADGDGDLDLAAGTAGDGAALYEFAGGGFGAAPRFTFMLGTNTVRVFLDDLDGDADPDLVLANTGQSASFTNFDGFFATSPSQTTPAPRVHVDGVVEDLDADGDLDLVLLAAPGDVSEFYAGTRGQFDAPTALAGTNAERVHAADVDADGDADLVTGSDTGFVTVVAGTAGPWGGGGPAPNAHALPNQEPWLRSVRMAPGGRNLQHFTVEAFDAENDSVWIVAESQVRGSRVWDPMDAGARHGLLGPFAASAAGVPLEFDWDLTRLQTTRDPFQVRFRSVAVRSRTGESQAVSAYAFAAGNLRVERPIIAAEPLFMRFSRVTVGDTTSAVLTVRNDGTEPLVIDQFEFDGTQSMRTNPPAPLVIGPGSHSEVFLIYEPQVPESSGPVGHQRFCYVFSNDPAHLRTTIELSVEAAALSGRAQALLPDSVATLGEPIVVQATPDPFVHIERATLYAGPPSGQHNAFPMKKRPGDFIGTIPGFLVRESGLEFYVQFENSGVLATDPPRAPDSLFAVPIGPPSRLVVTPQPTSRFDFLVDRDINVAVGLELGAEFTGGTLYYRRGGEVNFTTEPVLIDFLRGNLRATIPAAAVGPRGLEFYAKVHTLTDSLVYPKSGARAPDSIRTLTPSFSEPNSHAGGRYRMLSVPLDFGTDAARPLDALLSDQPEFGPYDPLRWRAFRYLGPEGNVERRPGDARFAVLPGRAFWVVSRAAHRVDTAPIEGLSVSVATHFPLVLEPGWNQIGNPFAFPVNWSRVQHSAAVEDPVAFDSERGASGEYRSDPVTVLVPFEGYFVYNRSAQAETLLVPPLDADLEPVRPKPAAVPQAAAWCIEVAAHSRAARDAGNLALVAADAQDGQDALDRREPPVPPAPWVGAAFRSDATAGGAGPALLRADARAPAPAGLEWRLEVRSSTAAEAVEVDLQVNGELPAGFALWMLDEETGSITPVDAAAAAHGWVRAARLRSHGPERACRLRLLAGTAAWLAEARAALVALPVRVTLAQNTPNPFNATTRVRFGLPAAAPAALEIFDARGRRVTVLVDEPLPAGWHDRLWDGRDAQGRPVATGIYFCRLRAGSAVQTRRLVLVE